MAQVTCSPHAIPARLLNSSSTDGAGQRCCALMNSPFAPGVPSSWARRQSRQRGGSALSIGGRRVGGLRSSSLPASAPSTASTASAAAGPDAEVLFHELPSSLRVEVLVQRAASGAQQPRPRPPLLFVHGSYHAAWCWQEHWMSFFAQRGYDCYAVSLLGQGNSDAPDAPVAGTIQSHAADLSHVIEHVVGRPPVLLGHSFGGLVVQAYLSLLLSGPPASAPAPAPGTTQESLEPLAAVALLCSVPPAGNKDLVARFLLTRPILSIKVTLAFAAKLFATNTGLCRDSFFSPDMPDTEVRRYQALMAASSKMPLFNLVKLNASLPVPRPPPEDLPPMLILGAANDAVLDEQALQETSEFFEAPYSIVPNIAHDIMLDTTWESAASALLHWLDQQ